MKEYQDFCKNIVGLGSKLKRTKVFIIHNIIAPYRVPLFNKISSWRGIDLEVLFYAKTEKNRAWNVPKNLNFKYKIIPGLNLWLRNRAVYIKPYLFFYLLKRNPEYVIVGGFSFAALLALLYCKIFNKRLLLWSDATPFSERTTGKIRNAIRRILVRNSSAFIASGTEARKYFISLGAYPEKVAISIFTLDVEHFSSCCRKLFSKREEIKTRKGLSGRIILYSGQLIKRKGVIYLLKAFKILQESMDNISLSILGSGKCEKELKDYCLENKLKVSFAGFVQQDSLPEYFTIAELFVFPSLNDQWGVVINEAIATGLPIICSKWVGAAKDLIKNDVNGYIINPQDVDTLVQKMKELLQDDKKRLEMGRKSQEMMKLCTIDKATNGFIHAIILASKAKQHV